MKYKFFGTPNMLVKERKKKYFSGEIQQKPIFRFDSNGEYITEDVKLIEKLKSRFDHMEIKEENNAAGEEIKFKCKKCEFECDNKGELMQHYKHIHPKEV